MKPVEKLVVFAEIPKLTKEILNLVDVGMEIGFHDQLVMSKMKIVKHLVVSNEIIGVVSLACVDGNLYVVADVELVFAGVDSLVADVDEGFLVKHYVQSVLGSEHADWMIEILVFDSMIQMWMICMLVFLSLFEWKPLVRMKMVGDVSLCIKVSDTLFYLPGESNVGASEVFLFTLVF